MNEGFSFTPCSILIAISQVFSLKYTMGNMFGMFTFAFWVISALKCEEVNFIKFKSPGIPIRLFEYLDMPIVLIACAPCMCVHNMHAYCDVTRFAYDVNHVTMTSPAFTFHSCHLVGVRIVGTPCHHGLHHMGMM